MRLALLALAACTAHDPAIMAKLDTLQAQITANQNAIDALRQDLHRQPDPKLAQKLDAIEAKLERLAEATNRPAPPIAPMRREPDRTKVYAIKVAGHPSVGPADAKVTLVWIHDYADPYSNKSRPVVDELRKTYGNDLRIVYRDLVVHPRTAFPGALAACAADKQKAYAAFDNLLWERSFAQHAFDPERCWETADGCPIVLALATELKLKLDKFRADMQACKASVDADIQELQTFAIGATPSWFINGRYMSGAMPREHFELLIDQELAKANASKIPKAKYYDSEVLAKGQPRLDP